MTQYYKLINDCAIWRTTIRCKSSINKPEFQEISVSIDRRVEEAIYGKKSPVEAAKDLKNDIEKILK